MKDEIKEILERVNSKYEDYYIQDILSGEEAKKLCDTIISLEKENERLKEQKNNCFR